MPRSDEPALSVMAEAGFERILALPALPAANCTEHGYATAIVTDAGDNWSLRSFGMQFSLVARSWLRSGMSRCYSLGWGLAAVGPTAALLLAQAFENDEATALELGSQLEVELRPIAAQLSWHVSAVWGQPCLRLAADIARSRN